MSISVSGSRKAKVGGWSRAEVGKGNSFQIKINAAAETTFMCPQRGKQGNVLGRWQDFFSAAPLSANQNAMKVNSLEN